MTDVKPAPNLTPAEHVAVADRLLARSQFWGNSPLQTNQQVLLATAHYAAATAKATAAAVYDTDFEGEVLAEATKIADAINVAKEKRDRGTH